MEAIINKLPEDINYMFYIKHRGDKRFSTYNPGKGTMGTGLVFTELYRKEHLLAICKWIAEDNSGEWGYQLRSAGGKKIYWEYDSMAATPTETPQISTEATETVNVSAEGENAAERAANKPKAERMKSKDDITEQLERIRVTFLSLPDWDLEPRVGRMAFAEDICKRYLENINQHLGLYDETEFCRYSDLKIPQLVYAAPQSPETPQTVECTADTPKPRETARKRQNRATGSTQHHQHSALGANGYAMLNDASATMAAMNVRQDTLRNTLRPVAYVPRECSTVDAAYW